MWARAHGLHIGPAFWFDEDAARPAARADARGGGRLRGRAAGAGTATRPPPRGTRAPRVRAIRPARPPPAPRHPPSATPTRSARASVTTFPTVTRMHDGDPGGRRRPPGRPPRRWTPRSPSPWRPAASGPRCRRPSPLDHRAYATRCGPGAAASAASRPPGRLAADRAVHRAGGGGRGGHARQRHRDARTARRSPGCTCSSTTSTGRARRACTRTTGRTARCG